MVIEIGQSSVRAGYSGDDCPKAIFPSVILPFFSHSFFFCQKIFKKTKIQVIGVVDEPSMEIESDNPNPTENITSSSKKKYFVGQKNVSVRKDHMNLESLFDADGIIDKWDHFERIIDYTLTNRLNVNPAEHPILLNEKSFATREEREKKV